jgi:hypothetical protein
MVWWPIWRAWCVLHHCYCGWSLGDSREEAKDWIRDQCPQSSRRWKMEDLARTLMANGVVLNGTGERFKVINAWASSLLVQNFQLWMLLVLFSWNFACKRLL